MDDVTRNFVRTRAQNRCEYCRIQQVHYPLWRHQIEHITPKKHFGTDNHQNLALACVRCNLGKSSNLSGIDSETRQVVELFNPRLQAWHEHFRFNQANIEGLTPTGRATVYVLNMNEQQRLGLRAQLLENGELD